MTKRFTDSEKFRDKWYRNLKPKHKCLWEYLLSECSIAGIIDFDYDSASFHIGEKITEADLKVFADRIVKLSDGKIFIPKFIKFQQNALNEKNPAHKNIIKELKKYGIDETLENIEFESTFNDPLMVQDSTISNSKGNSISNSNSKNKLGEFKNVLLTDEQIEKLKSIYDNKFDEAIETLSSYVQYKGKKYKDHYAVLGKHNWVYKKVILDNKPINNLQDLKKRGFDILHAN